MPHLFGGFSNSKSLTRVAAQPKCGPGCSRGMTLMQAAAEQRKWGKQLARAEKNLARAEETGNPRKVAAARREVKKVQKRAA